MTVALVRFPNVAPPVGLEMVTVKLALLVIVRPKNGSNPRFALRIGTMKLLLIS